MPMGLEGQTQRAAPGIAQVALTCEKFTVEKGHFTMKNGGAPIKKGVFSIKKGGLTIKNGG